MRRVLLLVVCLVVPLAVRGDAVPTLTEVQALKLQVTLQHLETAELRLRIAQDAYQRAQLEAQDMLKGLRQPGYMLDIQKMVYVPTPTPEPAGEKEQ